MSTLCTLAGPGAAGAASAGTINADEEAQEEDDDVFRHRRAGD